MASLCSTHLEVTVSGKQLPLAPLPDKTEAMRGRESHTLTDESHLVSLAT